MSTLRAQEQTKQHTDVENERQAKQALFDQQAAKRKIWLDSLPAANREVEERKIDAKLQKMADESNARAKGIYYYVVEHHTLRLAQRVISDPARRPIRLANRVAKVLAAGPTGMKEVKPRKTKTVDLSKAIEI